MYATFHKPCDVDSISAADVFYRRPRGYKSAAPTDAQDCKISIAKYMLKHYNKVQF